MFYQTRVLLVIIGVCFLPNTLVADVHIYNVEDSELRIYPTDITLTMRQKHAALNDLALMMNQGTAEDRTDFARIALYEMAVMYEEEALRQDKSGENNGIGLIRWRNETAALASSLYNVADSIDLTTPVDISIADTGEIHLSIYEKLYILSSPLINKPYLLDERIINNICRMRYCDPEIYSVEKVTNKRTIKIDANWVISENEKPRYVTSDGLNFVFDNIEKRSKKQIASLKVIKEIKLISETLKEARQKGVLIEWDTMTIRPLLGSYDYRINVNQFGDTVYVKLPELHHITDWQPQVMPWIHAQVNEKPIDQYVDADEFLAYTIHK